MMSREKQQKVLGQNDEVIGYIPSAEMIARLSNSFTYHAPKPGQGERYIAITNALKDAALLLVQYCPESRELSLALTHLEDARMRANSAIALNE